MNSTESDERVMARLAGGDEQALAELMNRWQGPIWCFINRMCAGLGATDDVYQETWMRVYLYRKRYRPKLPFRPYLFAVALNCCRKALRRAWQRDPHAGLENLPHPADPEPLPPDNLIADEQHRMLHRAIQRLPEMQRGVVLLYLLLGPDYGRIARVLGRSRGTVRSHMHHALNALRVSLSWISCPTEGEVDHERHLH